MLVPSQGLAKKDDAALLSVDDVPFTLVVHGGAGDTRPRPHEEAVHRAGLRRALLAGNAVLQRGGSALDAVTIAVSTLESDRSFNAGAGAVFTTQGDIELEASIMTSAAPKPTSASTAVEDSKDDDTHESLQHASLPSIPAGLPNTRRCASASLIKNTRNPVQLVRALYLNPVEAPHTFFTGRAAEELGWRLGGSHEVPAAYFWTKKRWLEHRRELGLPDFDDDAHAEAAFAGLDITLDGKPPRFNNGVMPPQVAKLLAPPSYSSAASHGETDATPSLVNSGTLPTTAGPATPPDSLATSDIVEQDLAALPRGTVGAVALDKYGVVACATSTGGKTNKLPGRLGDSAVPGAGFWAESWSVPTAVAPAAAEAEARQGKSSGSSLMQCLSSGCGSITPPEVNASVAGLEKLNVTQQPSAHGLISSSSGANSSGLSTVQRSMALSATGDGDYFLRCSFASLVAHRARFLGESVDTAAERAIEEMGSLTGEGGCIAVDEHGTPTFHMNTKTMNRGWIGSATKGTPKVAIWNDEECA